MRGTDPAAGPQGLAAPLARFSGHRLAYSLIRLDDLIVGAVTEGARELLGLPIEQIIGRPAVELIDPQDRAGVRTSIEALRSGAIDFFMAHRHGFGASHPSKGLAVWVYAVELDGVRYALSRWMDPEMLARTEPQAVGAIGRCAALIVTDGRGVVKATVDAHLDLGLRIHDLVGKELLPAAELARLLALPEIRSIRAQGTTVAGPVTVPHRSGGSVTLDAVATALSGTGDWLVALMDLGAAPSGREAELEGHLWKIAAEIEASGILLRAGSVPGLALARLPDATGLSPRQWEILRRIMAGQRVPAIAAELVVSQSTVRNHLSKIFERFDVHSQSELLASLARAPGLERERDAPPSTTDGLSIA